MRKKTGKNKKLVMALSVLVVTLFIATSMSSVVAKPVPNSFESARESTISTAAEAEEKAAEETKPEPQETIEEEPKDAIIKESIESHSVEAKSESKAVEEEKTEEDCPLCEAMDAEESAELASDAKLMSKILESITEEDIQALYDLEKAIPNIKSTISALSADQRAYLKAYAEGYLAGLLEGQAGLASDIDLKQILSDSADSFRASSLNSVIQSSSFEQDGPSSKIEYGSMMMAGGMVAVGEGENSLGSHCYSKLCEIVDDSRIVNTMVSLGVWAVQMGFEHYPITTIVAMFVGAGMAGSWLVGWVRSNPVKASFLIESFFKYCTGGTSASGNAAASMKTSAVNTIVSNVLDTRSIDSLYGSSALNLNTV